MFNFFRKTKKQTRVRNDNGMYARKVPVKNCEGEISYFYMTSKKGFIPAGK